MKVKELIEYLQTLDGEKEVWVSDTDYPDEPMQKDHILVFDTKVIIC